MDQFRVRTEFSFRKAYGQLPKIIAAGKAAGATSMAITDPNTFGHVSFHKQCIDAGIKPILGIEMIVKRELTDPMKMTCLFYAVTNEGLSELYGWSSIAAGQGNAITFDDLNEMSDGILVVAATQMDEAIMGRVDMIEVNPASKIQRRRAMQLAEKHQLHIVPTSDAWYPSVDDRATAQLMGVDLKPTPQWMLNRNEAAFYMPDVPVDAYRASSLIINALCDNVAPVKAQNIRHPMDLEKACRAAIGAKVERWTNEYEERLTKELKAIHTKGFEDYFAMLSGMCVDAKSKMLVGPARGSAAGSLVCFLLDITEVDPIVHDLLFERFIDETRHDYPDIDLDFPDDKRALVFDYLRGRYGESNVAKIGTVSRLKGKSAIGSVAKRLGIPPWETDEVKNAMIVRPDGDARANFCIADTFATTDAGRDFIAKFPAMANAAHLEEHADHSGVHAAGAIVCNLPVRNYCTVNAEGVAQIDKKDAEEINLMKVDVLGLRTLSVIEATGIDVRRVPLDDPDAYAVFNAQRYAGIFQFEGKALQGIANVTGIHEFEDIVATTSLARPGPLHSGGTQTYVNRMIGREKIELVHPVVDAITASTRGIIVYQEQMMAILREFGCMEWPDVQKLRRAMSKSYGAEFFAPYLDRFVAGAKSLGAKEELAKKIWNDIVSFGAYAFNKCIAGDTKIHLANNNVKGETSVTIAELYRRYEKEPSAHMRRVRSMPTLLSLTDKGRGFPQKAFRIYKNGVKECVKLKFTDGSTVTCTEDHKFLINGVWKKCGDASIGDEFSSLIADHAKMINGKVSSAKGKKWNIVDGDRTGSANPSFENGRTAIFEAFKIAKRGLPCEECGAHHHRMEAHHTDFSHGEIDPCGLMWLCPSCHKKEHYANGRTKQNERGRAVSSKTLVSIKKAGRKMTYDIEMPTDHNYMLANGLITHNSHAVAYGIISYWCAWLKAHHPLEFAYASLKHAKDNDQAVQLLREIINEGQIEYVPFDREHSQASWSIHEGKILGGLTAIKGIADKTAAVIVRNRAEGKLTAKQDEILSNPNLTYSDLFPARRLWGHLYDDPKKNGIGGPVSYINELTVDHDDAVCIVARLIKRTVRDLNDPKFVAGRGGKLFSHDRYYLNCEFEDDTDKILCAISRRDFAKPMGIILRNAPPGSWWLIRGDSRKGFRKLYITKMKRLS